MRKPQAVTKARARQERRFFRIGAVALAIGVLSVLGSSAFSSDGSDVAQPTTVHPITAYAAGPSMDRIDAIINGSSN